MYILGVLQNLVTSISSIMDQKLCNVADLRNLVIGLYFVSKFKTRYKEDWKYKNRIQKTKLCYGRSDFCKLINNNEKQI